MKLEVTNAPRESDRPDKTKILRNRDVDKAAAAIAEDHVLPEPPGKDLSWDQMQEYLALLSPGMWNHLSVYVYRLKPKIRRQLKDPDAPNYIDVFGEPFTLEYLIGHHGGGKYMLQATDSDKPRNKREVFQCFVTIDDVKHPPILEFDELELEARENQSYITWLRSQGILDAKGKVVQNSTAAASPAIRDVVDMMKAVKDMTTDKPKGASDDDTLSKAVGNILVERMKQDDPTKQVEATTKLVSGVREMLDSGKSDSGIAKIYEHLIIAQNDQRKIDAEQRIEQRKLDADQRKHDLEMFKMVLEANRPGPDTDVDKLTKMFGLAQQIFDARPNGRRSGWDIGYDLARDVALPAIQSIGSIFMNIMALRRGVTPQNAPGAAQPVPTSFDPYRDREAAAAYAASLRNQPPPTPAAAAPTPAAAPPPGPAPAPESQQSPPSPTGQIAEIFQNYGGLVLNALNNGTRGYDFADYVVGLMGTGTHALIAQHGEPALVAVMKEIPEFAVFGEARLKTFVTEFINFEEFGDDVEDENPEPEQIDVSKVFQPRERERSSRR